jgi:hypothetical protein
MSEKRNVPTFCLNLKSGAQTLEGPVVSPDRRIVAENLSQLHEVLHEHGACLVHAGSWIYIPTHSIDTAMRGTQRFSLPWPLVDG